MHTCEEYRILISALIDGEISDPERSLLMEHIAECDDCQTYLNDQILIHEAVQSMDCTAPVGFADGVMARVRDTKQDLPEKKIIPFPHWKRFASLAACCAVIALGVFAMDGANLSAESTADCAAPEMAYVTNSTAPQSEEESPAQATGSLTGTVAEMPDAATKSVAGTPPMQGSQNNGTYAADSSQNYTEYGLIIEYAARLTTASDIAAAWVHDHLEQEWISGTYYLLSPEEYAVLRDLLLAKGEAFTEVIGVETSNLYQLLAE